MSFPEPEILNSLVARIFRIDDVTTGDPQKGWIVRYRGHLLDSDSAAAYDLLADSVRAYGLTPLFRKEGADHVILLAPSMPEVKKRPPTTNVVMFILTTLTVMLAGATPIRPYPEDFIGQITVYFQTLFSAHLFTGWPFAVSLMAILLAHEFGHYLMSRRHKTAATLPFFLPLPLSPFGTLGAFIQMQAIPKNKRTLFDIGVAGPLAGMVVAIPVLFLGLSMSTLSVIDNTPSSLEGNSLFYLFAKYLIFHQLLPAPLDTNGMSLLLYWIRYFFTGYPPPIGGTDVFITKVALAGWLGLLVTALNLIPAGTLDGGHITYSMFGEKARKIYPYVIGILAVMSLVSLTWLIWALLLLFLGRVHAEPLDQITELDPRRRAVGVLAIVIFILVFSPVPMVLLG